MAKIKRPNLYCTIKQIVADPDFGWTFNSIRSYVARAGKNGLSVAIRRIGNRVYIRKDLFIRWMESKAMLPMQTEEVRYEVPEFLKIPHEEDSEIESHYQETLERQEQAKRKEKQISKIKTLAGRIHAVQI